MEDIARLGLALESGPFVAGGQAAGRALDDIKAKASSSLRSVQQFEDTVAKSAMTLQNVFRLAAAGFAALKIADYVRDAVQLAARYETLGIVLHQLGEGAGYSRTQLDNLTRSLQATGISMLQSRQTLLGMIEGHMDLARAVDLARIAQNAAVVANLNSSDTLARLQYGIQSAQVDVLRTIGINVNFEASYAKLAAQLHTTVGALDEQQKMTARTNAVVAAAVPLTGAYEAAMGTASKQMKSMERYAEDLKVRLGTLFTPTYNAAVMGLAEALKLAAGNIELLMVPLAALAAYKLAELISGWVTGLQTYVVASTAAKVAANQEALGHLAVAGAAVRQADALVVLTAATVRAVEGTGFETYATGNLVQATNAATAARTALSAAQILATETSEALTVSQLALAAATNGVRSAFNFLATNWVSATFIAIAAAVAFLATHESDLEKLTKKYGDTAAEAGNKALAGVQSSITAEQFHTRQQTALHALTKEQIEAERELQTVRDGVYAQSLSLYTTDQAMATQFNAMISGFRSGALSAGEFNEKLSVFQEHWSKIHPELAATIAQFDQFHATLVGVQTTLDDIFSRRQQLAGVTFSAPGSAAPSADPEVAKLTQSLREKQAASAAVAAALSGGQRATEAVERQNAAIREGAAAWKSLQDNAKDYVPAASVATVKTLTLRDALTSGDDATKKLAKSVYDGALAAQNYVAKVDLQKQSMEQLAGAARSAAADVHALHLAQAQQATVSGSLGNGPTAIAAAEHSAELAGREDAAREQIYARYADRVLGVTARVRELHKAEADRAADAVASADSQQKSVEAAKAYYARLAEVKDALQKTAEQQLDLNASMTGSAERMAQAAAAATFWKTALADGAAVTGDFTHASALAQAQLDQWAISVKANAHDEQVSLEETRDAYYRRAQAQLSGIAATRQFAIAEAEITERAKLLKMGLSETLPQFQELVRLAGTNAGQQFDQTTGAKQVNNTMKQLQQEGAHFFTEFFNQGLSSARQFVNEFKNLMVGAFANLLSQNLLNKVMGFFNPSAVMPQSGYNAGGAGGKGLAGSAVAKGVAGAAMGAFAGYEIGSAIGYGSGNSTVGLLGGAAGGAAAGAMVGGVPGAIAGGLVGAISGLIGAHKKAKEAAEAMAKAQEQLALDMAAFHATANGTNTDLQQQLRQNQATRDKLFQETNDAYKGTKNEPQRFAAMDQIERDAAANAQRIAMKYAQEVFDVNREQQARGLEATGNTRGAEDIRRQMEEEKQLRDAQDKGYDDATVAAIKYAQALEDAAIASRRAKEDLVKAQQAQKDLNDLQARYLAATGDDAGARRKQFEQAQLDERNKAVADERSPEYMTQLTTTQDAESNKFNADEAKTTLQKQQAEDNAKADLAVRGLVATGQTYLAASQDFTNKQRQEMQQAADQSESYRAQLAYTQKLEKDAFDQKQAIERQTAYAQFQLDLANAKGGDTFEASRTAYWAQLAQQSDQAKQSAKALYEAGVISNAEFQEFAKTLDDKLAPAARKAADAVAYAAQKLANIETSSGEADKYFKYTKASTQDQSDYYANLYGFQGKSRDDIIKGLVKPSTEAMQQLTEEQTNNNKRIYEYLDIFDRLSPQLGGNASPYPPGYGPLASITGSAFQGLSVVEGNRLGDIMEGIYSEERKHTDQFDHFLGGGFSSGGNASLHVDVDVNVRGDATGISEADKRYLLSELRADLTSIIGRETRRKIALDSAKV